MDTNIKKIFYNFFKLISYFCNSFGQPIRSYYKKKKIKNHFIIKDLLNLDENIAYKKNHFTDFKIKLHEFMALLKQYYCSSACVTIYKFGDGDYFFLKRINIGSAKPGNRALSKSYDEINHDMFITNSKKNDIYACEIIQPNLKYFYKCFSKKPDYPAEFCYILIANKWIFKNFQSIGLIGAKEKLNIIKKLLGFEEYKKYLGIDDFKDYIDIPQRFACDNCYEVEKYVSKKLSKSDIKIYLCGMGHLKSFLLCNLKKYHNAIYLDIGAGIDALAGIIDKNRPYFGNWTNYQFKDKKVYENIDYMNYYEKDDISRKFIDVN